MTDHYAILQISRTASPDEVKTAFRKLAHVYHPDKGGDPEKMKALTAAYAILSNPEKRRSYDIQIGVTVRTYTAPNPNGPHVHDPFSAVTFAGRTFCATCPEVQRAGAQMQQSMNDLQQQMAKAQQDFDRMSSWYRQHQRNHYGI